jgi:hypothetical protein
VEQHPFVAERAHVPKEWGAGGDPDEDYTVKERISEEGGVIKARHRWFGRG